MTQSSVFFGEDALRTFDRCRKLVATARSLGDTLEAVAFLEKAGALLKPYGMVIGDLEAPPVYVGAASREFRKRPNLWGAMKDRMGWVASDPASEAYRTSRPEDQE